MTLAELFTLEPAPIYGQFVRRVTPLGSWPERAPLKPGREKRRANDQAYRDRKRARKAA